MNQTLKTLIDRTQEVCDKIDALNGNNGELKLRDMLAKDFVSYVLYLSASDGKIDEQESKFLYEYFGIKLTPDEMAKYIEDNEIYSVEFEREVPKSLKVFTKFDSVLIEKGVTAITQVFSSELLIIIFRGIGEAMIRIDGEVDGSEIADWQMYIAMLDSYVRDTLNESRGYLTK